MPFINSKITKKITREDEATKGSIRSNEEDIAYVEVNIFGNEDKEAFNNLTAEITKIFNEVLGIEPERIYVKYETTTNWGWNGGNF